MTTAPPSSTDARWMGVGSSRESDAAAATRTALGEALAERTPAAVLLFVSPRYDVPAVARVTRELLGTEVPVVGCTTSGEIAGSVAGSGNLVAVAIGGPGLTVQTSVGMLDDGPRTAGERAARALDGLDRPHKALMLLADGLAGARAEVVRGAYGVTGAAVPLVGGCAGDDLAMEQTWQIHGDEVLTGAVVGLGIASEGLLAIGVGHGWRRLGDPLVVTDSDGQRILTLDDQPATEAYFRAVGRPVESLGDRSTWQYTSLLHPIGLTRPGGEEIRAVLGVDFEEGSLFCGDVPQGTVISVMEGDAGTVDDGTQIAVAGLLEQLGGAAPVGVVAFDCAARRAVLGDGGLEQEIGRITDGVPGVPLAGFYTYGEFARTRGARGVHNATLALLGLT